MKKNSSMKYLRIHLFLFSLLAISCTRDQGYRNQYVGTYQCVRNCSTWMINQPTTYSTSYSVIEVRKDPHSRNGVIINNDTMLLDNNGSYSYSEGYYYGYSIHFRNDSLFIQTRSGGLGGTTNCLTSGVKQ